jgi:hypothetical protein
MRLFVSYYGGEIYSLFRAVFCNIVRRSSKLKYSLSSMLAQFGI